MKAGARSRLRGLASSAAPATVHRLWEQRVGRESLDALERIAAGPRPIVAGPWQSEVGFELLYWVPFLRWFAGRFGVGPDDMVACSRGGVASWYGDVASGYVELFDLLEPAELQRRREARIAEASSEKQARVTSHDEELLVQVRERLGSARAGWLHPSLMYRLFNVVWTWNGAFELVLHHTRFRRLSPPPPPPGLPTGYVAVKAYASACLPDTHANREFVRAMLADLSRERPVVLLRTGLALDDHVELGGGDVIDAGPLLGDPRTNLGVQTAIVGAAAGLVATHGGFAYLGPLLGTPTRSFYSEATFNTLHGRVMRAAAAELAATEEDVRPQPLGAFSPPPVSSTPE